MKESKIQLEIDRNAIIHLAKHGKDLLLKEPLCFNLIDESINPLTAWRRGLLLNCVLERIISTYFVCEERTGAVDREDLPLKSIQEDDISWLNHVLNNNKLFPFQFKIYQEPGEETLFFESRYKTITQKN